uniref:Uncharacterized protein n=1 Tax=Periophthalmus magnuspinnatus TaxID=409849 RepID=A0A3B4B9G1_9GOBI
WYQYAEYVADSHNRFECYVCTHLPLAAANPHVLPLRVPNISLDMPETLVSRLSPKTLGRAIWSMLRVEPPEPQYPVVSRFVPTIRSFTFGLVLNFLCYTQIRSEEQLITANVTRKPVYVGKLRLIYCSVVYSPCTYFPGSFKLNVSQAAPGSFCAPYYAIPDVLGTVPSEGYRFLCSYGMYDCLPQGWICRCAAAILADHSYILPALPHAAPTTKCALSVPEMAPHDPLWGTDVPDDHKLWTTGEKVLLSLFPQVGVGKLMLRMETLSYRFSSFVNTTISILEAQRAELHGLRAVALQNRIVLDHLTASMGGVCAIIGSSCCTYIPANDEDGRAIQRGIKGSW